ncbi:MAG: HupE/UreJ family protein [Myxococcota bacterium]|nr:HupE/UreJ family protein [Myxococcota bacterium]
MRRLTLIDSIRIAIALVLTSSLAHAHPLDIGYLRIESKGASVAVALDLNPEAAMLLVGAKAPLDEAALRTRAPELAAVTFAQEPITTPAGPCTWSGAVIARIEGQSIRITDTATCPDTGERRWKFPFVRDSKVSGTFELLVKEKLGSEEKVKLVDRYEPELVLGAASASYSFLDFVWSGVEHIGAAPNQWHDDNGFKLADGIDHILFLLALMLGGGTLLRLIGIATGFTLGHSITLALAVTGLVRPPLSIIEPIIALSIALAAAESIYGKFEKHRWKIATGFGFVHGFGFAAALLELELQSAAETAKALFGYNLGVELGQVGIVLVIAPLVLLAHKSDFARKYVLRAIAALIFVAGMYWFFTRL